MTIVWFIKFYRVYTLNKIKQKRTILDRRSRLNGLPLHVEN